MNDLNSKSASHYCDGHPLDQVQYLEVKLILLGEAFTSIDSLLRFSKVIRKTAKHSGIQFHENDSSRLHPDVREVAFFDTADFRLYKNAFILRRRLSLKDGFAHGDPEVVCKFRHPSAAAAAKVDMRPKIRGNYKMKFKEEVLPSKEVAGGTRTLFSHNCQFEMSQFPVDDGISLTNLVSIIPALDPLLRHGRSDLSVVNHTIVEETLLPLGHLEFSDSIQGKCDVGVWRAQGRSHPMIGEFAYQLKFKRSSDLGADVRTESDTFFKALQNDLRDQIALGTTKTGAIYRCSGQTLTGHE